MLLNSRKEILSFIRSNYGKEYKLYVDSIGKKGLYRELEVFGAKLPHYLPLKSLRVIYYLILEEFDEG